VGKFRNIDFSQAVSQKKKKDAAREGREKTNLKCKEREGKKLAAWGGEKRNVN